MRKLITVRCAQTMAVVQVEVTMRVHSVTMRRMPFSGSLTEPNDIVRVDASAYAIEALSPEEADGDGWVALPLRVSPVAA